MGPAGHWEREGVAKPRAFGHVWARRMADLPSNLEVARRRLGGLPYVGSEPSVALLTEAELGELAALVWHPRRDAADPWVAELRAALRGRFPRFEASSAVAALAALSAHGAAAAASGWVVSAAAQVIEGCLDPKAPEVQAALERLLGGDAPVEPDPLLVAVWSCTSGRLPEHPDPFPTRSSSRSWLRSTDSGVVGPDPEPFSRLRWVAGAGSDRARSSPCGSG